MESESKVYLIPNTLAKRAGIAGSWRSANEIAVFPNIPMQHDSPDKISDYAPDDAAVFNVRPEVILYHPIIRKLVNESNVAFLNVQAFVAKNPKCGNVKAEMLKFSRHYRSIIRGCLENIQDELMRASVGPEKNNLTMFMTVFYSVECIWHFSEIIFVENVLGNVVLPNLLDWVRFHIPAHERNAAELLSGPPIGLDSNPKYWDTVIGCLIQGRIEVSSALLRLHSDGDAEPYRLVVQCLQTFPIFSVQTGISVSEHQTRWRQWRIETQSKLDAKLFYLISEDENLEFIVKVMLGEEAAWLVCAQDHCETWYELLAGWLFYTEPTVQRFELGGYAKRCMNRMSDTGKLTSIKHIDLVLLAAMQGDFEFITELQHLTENGWCITHLTDLLYHCGQIIKWQPIAKLACKLRDTFLLDYAVLLMSHKSLWQVGLTYLDNCKNQRFTKTRELLQHLPINSTLRVDKVIREALKRNLLSVVQSVCRIQAKQQLNHGHLGNALNWALKSQDANFITYLADQFLINYTKTGKLQHLDLLENLGPSMLSSDRLVFLGKYCEFQKIYESADYKTAANLLMSLIESKLTPKYFWYTLFMDALPLLECDQTIISSNDNYILMNCLEEKVSKIPELADKVELLRYALSRNLGRALIDDQLVQ